MLYEEHEARVCEQELVPLFGVGNGRDDAVCKPTLLIGGGVVGCPGSSSVRCPTVPIFENWRASVCSALCLIRRTWVNVFRSAIEIEGRSAGDNVQ